MITPKRKVYYRMLYKIIVIGVVYFVLHHYTVTLRNAPAHYTPLSKPMVEVLKASSPDTVIIPYFDTNDQIIVHPYHVLKYDESIEQASWLVYLLKEGMVHGHAEPANLYKKDLLVRTGSAEPGDYLKTGYAFGQLMAPESMKFSQRAMDNTFLMSNVAPQDPGFDRHIWSRLDDWEREWARREDTILIATGPVFIDSTFYFGLDNEVSIPQAFYKIVVDYTAPNYKAIAFVIGNSSVSTQVYDHATTIDSVEILTGIDFFYRLPDSIEHRLESDCNTEMWFFETKTDFD